MKYVLIFLVFLVLLWRWRTAREGRQKAKAQLSARNPSPDTMACCAHCGVHLPAMDSIQGRSGVYCSPAHQSAAER